MKTLNLKSVIRKSSMLAIALTVGVIGYLQSNAKISNHQSVIKLRDMYRISNANAEGTITCGDAGSPCTTTYNGQAGWQVSGHKN